MATGKHYRGSSSAPQKAPQTNRTPTSPVKTDDYEDLYSYEEPRGAKRGTRRAPRKDIYAPVNAPVKKKNRFLPPLIAVLCLLSAAAILLYILWDLGIIRMLLSLLK